MIRSSFFASYFLPLQSFIMLATLSSKHAKASLPYFTTLNWISSILLPTTGRGNTMASCTICSTEFTFFENLTNRSIQRCKKCDTRMKELAKNTTAAMWQVFNRDHYLTADHEQKVLTYFTQEKMPLDLGQPVIQQLRYIRQLSEINVGNVPRITTSLLLDSDEYAHFEVPVTYYKPNKNVKIVPGRLIGTNKKCYFISSSGTDNATIDWNNVSQVYESSQRITTTTKYNGRTLSSTKTVQTLHIAVSKGSGGGNYGVSDMLYTRIIINTLVRLWKRQLVIYQETKTYGPIPEHVKAAVFRRDGGKCVQCGYMGDYIEYDHKHPRSKGGQNTEENIQLLCRKCNLKKGARI